MRPYKYTDKLLFALFLCNIWMFIPSIWGIWWNLSLYFIVQGDGSGYLTTILLSTAQWLVVLSFTTWAFFKRWRLVVLFYVIYLSRMVPIFVPILIQYWKENDNLNFLSSAIYGYTYVFLWLLGLITILVMLIETDYGSLGNKCRRWISQL